MSQGEKYHCKFCLKERKSEEYTVVDQNQKIVRIVYRCGSTMNIVFDGSGKNKTTWFQKCR